MQKSTIQALNTINSQFYKTIARDFDESRNHYWPGWQMLLKHIKPSAIKNVLDIGSGNGRFGTFSKEHFPNLDSYLGLDNSIELLEAAKKQATLSNSKFSQLDVVTQLLSDKPLVESIHEYDLIALFGVMHHIPSFELRKKLLIEISKKLSKNGILVFTTWQFMEFERFTKKLIDASNLSIQTTQLEENDYFLDWQRGESAIRYCHYHTQDEVKKLIHNSGVSLIKTFRADGKEGTVNCYYILKKES